MDTYENEEDEQEETPPQGWRKKLEKDRETAKAEATEAKAELEKAQREVAFMKAGLDPADKKVAIFAKAYEGEVTSEAIKAAYDETFGETPAVSKEEAAAHERVAQTAAGATSTTPQDAVDKLVNLRNRMFQGDPSVTLAEAQAAIREAGVQFGNLEHGGVFSVPDGATPVGK